MLRRWYRLAWTATAGVVAFAGVSAGVVLLRSWTLFFLAMTAVCLGLAASAAFADIDQAAPGRTRTIAAFAVGLIGTAGLVTVLEWVAFALLATLAAAAVPLLGPGRLSTPDLCARWNAGLDALRTAATPAEAAAILRDRQRCLDELERRDPDGFRRWLATPGADPATVLRPHQGT
ncbi:hypothetical protein [Actinokineospora iranica]|uniref:Uncharacterized protein n=1 Tax=Actinokineospora iranica TaxID=1271860 RepID=A0A1G6RXF8_9PSEU|nr:hypothetical protein [Actinokineospora iranica]SDD08616.1 hypothetical protein SAMN05216174_10752 [Actinokineospora iranica]